MNKPFVDSEPGVQINWDDVSELEFLGYSVLEGTAQVTTATWKDRDGMHRYSYPVSAERTGEALVLRYERRPSSWRRNWEMYRGTLKITFQNAQAVVPKTIWWWLEGHLEPDELKRGRDWEFVSRESASKVTFEPRGRLQVSRLTRPKQQEMRSRLLSEYGGCQVTGVRAESVLEACHIVPVKNGGNDRLANLLLLRRDLHALFDAGELRFNHSGTYWHVEIDDAVNDKMYRDLHGAALDSERLALHQAHLLARAKLEEYAGPCPR